MTRVSRRALAFLAVVPLVAALAGCGGAQPSGSPAAPSTPAPSSNSAPPSGEAPAGALMMVVANELRMRAAPGTGSDLVGGLERGDVVEIVSEPADADGFTWYEAIDIGGRRGWVAEGDGSDAWLSALPAEDDGVPMLSFEFACDVTGPFQAPSTLIFEHGRVVHHFSATNAWQVRTLSAAGLADVRSNILGSPYLQASADYVPVPRPDAGDPPGHGVCGFTFVIATDGAPIEVTSINWFGDEEESEFYQPSPERKTLDAMARNLMAIDQVLGEPSWEPAGWLPWIPEAHLIGVGPGEGPLPDGGAVIEPGSTGLGDLAAFGAPAGRGRCGVVSREQAFGFARALNEAGHDPAIRLNTSTSLVFGTEAGWTYGLFHPSAPGTPDCEELDF